MMCQSKTHEVNEIAKKLRTRQYVMNLDSGPGSQEHTAIMRDIHPDEAYEILGMHITEASKIGAGVVHYIAFAKNSSGEEPTVVLDDMVSKVGPFVHFEPTTPVAAGTSHYSESLINFPEPIPFDENDQLNCWMYSGGADTTTYVVNVFYRLK